VNSIDTTHDNIASPPAYWGFWGTVLWSGAIFAIFLVLQGVAVLAVVLSQNDHPARSQLRELLRAAGENGYVLSIVTLITTTVCCALVAGVIKLKKGAMLVDYLSIRTVAPRVMLKWLGLLVCVVVLSDSITALLGRPIVPDFVAAVYATATPVWTIWVTLVILAPVFEETFFRGFLFRGLQSSFMGPIGAVIVTAGLWAIIHGQYDAYGIATVFVLGLLLGAARVLTQSLLVPLGLHATANLIGTIEAAIWGARLAT
jgi:membrane protease YdiL (CAAX protease family)